MAYRSVNPYDGKVLMTFGELTGEQLEAALATAAAFQAVPRRHPPDI